MFTFKVIGIVLGATRITHLVLDRYHGTDNVLPLGPRLKQLSDAKRLKVDLPGHWPPTVGVEVYFTTYYGWIARTTADTTTKNNLLSLPQYERTFSGKFQRSNKQRDL